MAIQIIEPSGKARRAGDIFTGGRLDLNNPLLAVEGVKVDIRTPEGHGIIIEKLAGMTPTEIDSYARKIDEVMTLTASRAPESIPEMVRVEAGTFPVKGSKLFDDKKPAEENVTISKPFYAGKYKVTVAEFREFVNDAGYEIIDQGADELKALLADKTKDSHPVVYVKKADRDAYVKWLREKTGESYYILTAAQQEYIRRGSSGRKFPWGDNWDPEALNWNTNETSPVDAHPKGATPEGIHDLAGNVWEATDSWYGKYDPTDTVDPKRPQPDEFIFIEVRGGSAWNDDQGDFLGAYRLRSHPETRHHDVGFRLAED